MRKTRLTKVLALTLAFMMVMSMTPVSAYTTLSNKLTATVTVVLPTPLEALNALNFTAVETDTEFKMLDALENEDLELNLIEFYKLTAVGRRQAVADFVSFVKFANGDDFETVADVQAALNLGVNIETDKMNLLQLLDGKTGITLAQIVAAIKTNASSIGAYNVDKINSFYAKYGGVIGINAEAAIMQSFMDLTDAQETAATALFMANPYDGSYVTVLGYLQTAIAAVLTENPISLKWTAGGTIAAGDSLAIVEAKVGDTRTISFEATMNKDVTNVGYTVSSNNYITINNITALQHYIDSESLAVGTTETIDVSVRFDVAGNYELGVIAIHQEDTTPASLSEKLLRVTDHDGYSRVELEFTLSEDIDLSQDKLGNIIISYGTMNGDNFVETLREDETPVVKSKLWDAYLTQILSTVETKYCSGAVGSSLENIVPKDEKTLTVVDPFYSNMKYADDTAWMAAMLSGNAAVKITVIDNEGNISETIITKAQ